MSQSGPRTVEHGIEISASAADVYRLIAEVQNWPRIFPPTIYVDHLGYDGNEERIRIWATANATAKTWTSRRVLDPQGRRIEFRQEVSAPPVAAMGGAWVITEQSPGTCRVRLLHDYRAVGDDPASLAWIDQAVDHNSTAELAALKANVELATAAGETSFSFQDTVHVAGEPKHVYDFISEADLWDQRLPHVAQVRLEEETPGLQTLEMHTRAKDGTTHLTKSYRVMFPHRRIAYKQVTLPALLSLHTGIWTFDAAGDGVSATSAHTVVLNTANIARVLGPDATVAQAARYVRDALSTNSRATLECAKTFVEGRAESPARS